MITDIAATTMISRRRNFIAITNSGVWTGDAWYRHARIFNSPQIVDLFQKHEDFESIAGYDDVKNITLQ